MRRRAPRAAVDRDFDMVLLLFAASGFVLGYRLGMTRRGFVMLAAVSLGSAAIQVAHLASTSDRSWMTMLPLIVGAVIVASMLLGALARRPSRPSRPSRSGSLAP